MKEGRYLVCKDIPLDPKGEKVIPKGTELNVIHDVVYMDGGLVPPEYQADFRTLIETEEQNGYKYVHPNNSKVGKSII